jgi:hypothetical protein
VGAGIGRGKEVLKMWRSCGRNAEKKRIHATNEKRRKGVYSNRLHSVHKHVNEGYTKYEIRLLFYLPSITTTAISIRASAAYKNRRSKAYTVCGFASFSRGHGRELAYLAICM